MGAFDPYKFVRNGRCMLRKVLFCDWREFPRKDLLRWSDREICEPLNLSVYSISLLWLRAQEGAVDNFLVKENALVSKAF